MTSRERILAAVLQNQPPLSSLPDISSFSVREADMTAKYTEVFTEIGGRVFAVSDTSAIGELIRGNFDTTKRIVSTLSVLEGVAEIISDTVNPHSFADVELAVIGASIAVAENGAVWLTDQDTMGQRILPYISQHLAVLVQKSDIVSTMHDAYSKIGAEDYGFGGFIGGPSKTADIEQALVLGAHGPLSMTVFLIQ